MVKKICDICGNDASHDIKITGSGLSEVNRDLCEEHFGLVKKFLGAVINQDLKEAEAVSTVTIASAQ